MTPPPKPPELEALLESRDFLRSLALGLLRDEHRAEDAVQEACVRVLERPPRKPGALRAWLARVVRNAALDERARERRRPEVERRGARAEPLEPLGELGEREERELSLESDVLGGVRTLPAPYRTAIWLRYYRGLSPAEIARQLETPEATVKTRLRRGLELLRADLDRRHGGDRAAWSLGLVALALPELVPGAAGGVAVGALLKSLWQDLLRGVLLMNKPVTAAVVAVSLAAVATVAWIAGRDQDESGEYRAAASEPGRSAAAEPEARALAALEDSPAEDPEAIGAAAREAVVDGPMMAAAELDAPGFRGRVVDEGGNPVADALVRRGAGMDFPVFDRFDETERFSLAPVEARTDGDGVFHLPVEEDAPVQLVVEAPGFAPYRREVTGYYDRLTDVGDLALERGVILSGVVVDADGRPLAGAEVRASAASRSGNVLVPFGMAGDVVAETALDGSFVVDRQAVGPWTLAASAAGERGTVASGQTTRAGERVRDIRLELPRGASIEGVVTGAPASTSPLFVRASEVVESGSGGDGVFVFAGPDGMGPGRSAEVGPGGRFAVRGLDPEKTYRLRVYDDDSPWRARPRSAVVEADPGRRDVVLGFTPGASVELSVVDATSGEPIEDFVVRHGPGFPQALRRGGEVLRQHPEGHVRIDGLDPPGTAASGTVEISVLADGYAEWSEDVQLGRGAALELGAIALHRVPRVRVSVVGADGRPVAGAKVTLAPAPEREPGGARTMRARRIEVGPEGTFVGGEGAPRVGVTGADGIADLPSLPGERVELTVDAKRRAPYHGEPFVLPASLDHEETVRLFLGASAEVLVLDGNGEPVPGARVSHRAPDRSEEEILFASTDGSTRITDSEGRAWFRDLAPGLHGFRLLEDGGADFILGGGTRIGIAGLGGETTPWTERELADGSTEEIVLSTESASALDGFVTEAGAALAGATLKLAVGGEGTGFLPMFEPGPTARTDAQGHYEFEGVEPGEYSLVVTHESRALPARIPVEVLEGATRRDVDLDVTIVRGRVTDPDGEPLAGVRVSAERAREPGARRAAVMISAEIDDEGGSGGGMVFSLGGDSPPPVETDEDGFYELRGLPADVRLRVRAQATDWSPAQSEPFVLVPYEEREGVDLTLTQGGSIVVEVVRADGSPVPQAFVLVRRAEADAPPSEPKAGMTDEQGRFRLADLEPGRWSVSAQDGFGSGQLPEPQEVLVEGGAEVPLRIELP